MLSPRHILADIIRCHFASAIDILITHDIEHIFADDSHFHIATPLTLTPLAIISPGCRRHISALIYGIGQPAIFD
jgi:hypothetical protein